MKAVAFAVAPLMLALPVFGHAQQSCPYINTETTSGALQTPATLTVRQQTPDGDVCDFLAGVGKMKRRLYVLVKPTPDTEHAYAKFREVCAGKPQVVNALGNEAWSCQLRSIPNGEAIFGRVRDTVFFVQMSGISDNAILQDKVSLAAEQVANNLY
jgi:hypothetical protein